MSAPVFYFVANLKPYTLPEAADDARFDAYLLSADYTSGLADLAEMVRAEQRVLVADNGNMDAFRSIIREFAAEAAELDTDRRAWEEQRGRYARPHELPKQLRERFRGFVLELAARSEAITTDAYAMEAVRRQASIKPSMLVGMEDLTLGAMGGLNLEPEYADLPDSFFEARIRRAVNFARRTIDGELGEVRGRVLAGLHALDYDSGVLAGRIAAEAGLDGVTLGMAGALTDRNYVDFRVEDGEVIELASAVPRPYLRVVEITAGVLEGFRRAGRPRPTFHGLGVGTPILLPLLALLGPGENYFATDSTAPIVDGWSSPTISLYVTDPAPLKYKAYKIANVWIRGGRGWDCECPYCARFSEAHPPEIGRARKWWREQGKPKIRKQMLERNGPLSALLPFLGYPADDELRTEAGLARVGHNHWVLRQLELEIRRRSTSWGDLAAWVGGIVDAYRGGPGSSAWKTAVAEAYTLAHSAGERLKAEAAPREDANRLAPVSLLEDDIEDDIGEDHRREQDDAQGDPPDHQAEHGVGRHESPPGVIGHGQILSSPTRLGNQEPLAPRPLVRHDAEQHMHPHPEDGDRVEQLDGDWPPHRAEPAMLGSSPAGVVVHGKTLSDPTRLGKQAHPGTQPAPGSLVGHLVEPNQKEKERGEPEDQVDGDGAPHRAEPAVLGSSPAGVVDHGWSLARPPFVGNLAAGGAPGYDGVVAGEFLMGYGEPLNSHQASRALLRRTLDELSQVEKLPRSWEALQPVAASLEGHAATVLGVLRSNTAAVRVRLDQRRRRVDAWRDVLSEVAGSDSEDAQTWREALLTAASENFDADEAEARVEALLHGQAPLLRAVELGNRAAVCDQSAYLATYTAASAAGSRLSCLATHLAAAEPGVGDGEPSPLDDASVEWVGSLAGDVAEFGSVGFSQFHDLFAGEQASVSAAGSLARSTLDQARARGLLISQVLGALSRQGIAPELLAEMGPVAVSLAESGARLQLLVAYASHVLAHSHSLDADSWLASEREAAELEFASKVPTGTQARIDDVGGLAEGELVEVQGRVQSLVLEHDPKPPKFSSFVVLRAFDTDASVRLRAHMFSLERNGLVEGACCKIRGFVRRQRGWLGEDETGLDIDRVSLSKLRKLSWLDDVAYRMRPFFRLYQDEMSLFNTPGGV